MSSKPDAEFRIKATKVEDGWLLDVTLDADRELTTIELTEIMVGATNMVLDERDEWIHE